MYNDNLIKVKMGPIEYIRQSKFIYKALWSTSEVEHFVFFSIDSRGYLEGTFGLRNQLMEEFGIDSILKYGHPNRQIIRKYRNPQTACTMNFDFGRLDRFTRKIWPRMRVQDVSDADLADFVTGFICRHIFPLVRHIKDLSELLALLVSNDEFTPWFASAPGARAAQVVALSVQLGMERNQIHKFLAPYECMIAVDIMGGKVDPKIPIDGFLDNYIDQLLSDVDSQVAKKAGADQRSDSQ